jgi:hypothetical protein
MATSSTASMAFIGANGQIMLGKQFAGQQVTVEQREPGVWLIKAADTAANAEPWLQNPKAMSDLKRAIEWAQSHPAGETDFEVFEKKMNDAP